MQIKCRLCTKAIGNRTSCISWLRRESEKGSETSELKRMFHMITNDEQADGHTGVQAHHEVIETLCVTIHYHSVSSTVFNLSVYLVRKVFYIERKKM